jgi:hypothetical protein
MITVTTMGFIIGLAAYFAFGFLFMIICAKMGLIGKYEPSLFYWIFWPVAIFMKILDGILLYLAQISYRIETFVDTLKPQTKGD